MHACTIVGLGAVTERAALANRDKKVSLALPTSVLRLLNYVLVLAIDEVSDLTLVSWFATASVRGITTPFWFLITVV